MAFVLRKRGRAFVAALFESSFSLHPQARLLLDGIEVEWRVSSKDKSRQSWRLSDLYLQFLASGQSQMVQLIFPFFDDLVLINPNVALPRQHIHVCF